MWLLSIILLVYPKNKSSKMAHIVFKIISLYPKKSANKQHLYQ
jgi:hypothetical protein